ncbi:hemagglutinin protein [Aurantibacter sp.]|uniref:hemagglutinin protein n=1 Tax=Aurantibacter sp. TaxID=2807103 RepID=UPI0035C7D64F
MKNIFSIVFLLVMISGFSQSLERQVIGSAGSTLTNASVSLDFTVGELVVSTLTDGTTSLSQGFHQGSKLSIILDPIVFLQGAALNPATGELTLMRDDLRSNSYIPTTSPYGDALTCDVNVFNTTGDNAIVDWVWIELRDETDNTIVEASRSALLQRDGNIVDVDGTSYVEFELASGNYYVSIHHRNHLGIISNGTITLAKAVTIVDFTDVNNQITYGSNAQTTFGMPTDVVGMWAGDVNNDGRLNYLGANSEIPFISSQVFNDPDNSLFGGPPTATYSSVGYYGTDVDMNGETIYIGPNSEIPYISSNIFNNSSNSIFGGPPTATFEFLEQIPSN